MAYAYARTTRARLRPAADPNVIPFIDVLLVLLIIFMVTAPRPTTDLKVELPRGRGAPPIIEPTIVDLRADPAGFRIFIGSRELGREALAAGALAHILAANPVLTVDDAYAEARVFVRSDLDVAYAPVVGVVETLQHSGFRRVSIIAQNADER